MEAGTLTAERERTLATGFQDLVGWVQGLPPAVKAAFGLAPLFAVFVIAEEQGLPDGALKVAAFFALFVAGVAALTYLRGNPAAMASAVIADLTLLLILYHDLQLVADTALTGLSTGSIYALGAVGLTLVYGILKLVNFAHGDFITFGAYIAFAVNVSAGVPLAVAVVAAMAATALLGVFFERAMWGPMRARGAGLLQLLLMSIGLALLIRGIVQMIWSTEIRTLDVNTTATVDFLGLSVGRTALIVIVIGFVVLVAIGLMLRYSLLGKQMRALSDDLELAETAGVNTDRVVILTWVFSGALAGLAGALAATSLTVYPELGFELLLALFAAVVIGGIGNPFGALAGGIVLGLVIEWSTLLVDARWKLTFGFAVLILVLIFRPQGIFGRARTV
jgi:neutral amino acid transport system permease protein